MAAGQPLFMRISEFDGCDRVPLADEDDGSSLAECAFGSGVLRL
jgi:hypothetical protein